MAVQYFEETVVYPSVHAVVDGLTISKILLGEDIAEAFGCVVDFKVGERLDAYNGLSVFKRSEDDYVLIGRDAHIERMVLNEDEVCCIPADLHQALKLLAREHAYHEILH